ncbi:unnamed protein product (macronuclear) [Paramecium tetraurelia]|uniref:Uncharacterized protein n=1 Tax=Paramecium tetraurelia TaxID=5888 RepID=A0BHT6_PARTE|nr:uncharacterized protein GSPATT00029139001 [Paramecium tetraurelia]CAK58103.1 unnamed protein product [Paramecium tetraurelia]|eukprot:XP_001425501.1 hypothetical protein (macronuclear) [Paramecium tetraurelia strain d4-2]
MNCTNHIKNQVSLICIAPHTCQFDRKLCSECLDEHQFNSNIVSIKRFKEMVMKRFSESKLDQNTEELIHQRKAFKSMLSETESKMRKIWEELEKSINQMYDFIEEQNKLYLNLFNQNDNLSEFSNSNLEQLVQILIGESLDDWNDLQNSQLVKLEKTKNQWEQDIKTFCEKMNIEMKEITSKIKIEPRQEIVQINEREKDLYEVLALSKSINQKLFDKMIKMLKQDKISNIIIFLQKEFAQKYQEEYMYNEANLSPKSREVKLKNDFQVITTVFRDIHQLDFNKKNFSTDAYIETRINIIKKIQKDEKIIEFLKFLVNLTAIDSQFIQCGSNSLNLLVEMKVDLKEQSFENIRIKDTSLIGGNFLRCNLNGSQFDNVDIGGVNLNGAQLFNCKWKNIKLNELNKLEGHESSVNSVSISPDGTILASGSADNSIRLWDSKTGELKAKLVGHENAVNQICFSRDGTTLASVSGDRTIRLWDVKTGRQKAQLDGHTNSVLTVCFSPDNTILASGSADHSVRLWDITTRKEKARLVGHSNSVCFSPDGTTLASGSGDNSIRLWDVKRQEIKAKLEGHRDYVRSICFSPDGKTLASCSADSSIRIWDLKTGKQKIQLDGHSDGVLSISFSPSGTTIASGSKDNSIRLWDVNTGQQKVKLEDHHDFIRSVCFSPDGTKLASGSGDKSLRLWDVNTEKKNLGYDCCFKDHPTFLKTPLKNNTLLQNVASNITILLISKQLIFQAQGALLYKGEFMDQSGMDFTTVLKQKGSLILDDQIEFQEHQS